MWLTVKRPDAGEEGREVVVSVMAWIYQSMERKVNNKGLKRES